MVTRTASLVCLAAVTLWNATAGAAQFTASVDRREFYSNEHVMLTLSLVNSETRLRARGVDPNIDLTVLAGQFELGTPRADFRYNIERNRGRATSELTVALFPKRAGRLVIPSFSVDGLHTEPITLTVRAPPGDSAPEFFARSGVGKRSLWEREQTLVYLDLYHRVNLTVARLGGAVDVEPREVELHELPQAERAEEVEGLRYNVTRTAWALAPRAAGAVTVHLPDIWIETAGGKRRRLPFRDERLEVRALPSDVPPGVPVGRPRLVQSTPEEAKAGGLVPREVTLSAPTALNTLPGTLPMRALPPQLKSYTDTAERKVEILPDGSVVSTIVYRTYLMPLTAGTYELPPLELPYFDTGSGRMALASLPGYELHVAPGVTRADSPPLPAGTDGHTVSGPAPAADESGAVWRTAAGVLLVLWLATAVLAWRLRAVRRTTAGQSSPVRTPPAPGQGTPKDRLLGALGARTLEEGLDTWERRHGPDPGLREAVRSVQRLCYGHERATEKELRKAVDTALRRMRRKRHAKRRDDQAEMDPWSPRAFSKSGNR